MGAPKTQEEVDRRIRAKREKMKIIETARDGTRAFETLRKGCETMKNILEEGQEKDKSSDKILPEPTHLGHQNSIPIVCNSSWKSLE
jgi:hypothetical protein